MASSPFLPFGAPAIFERDDQGVDIRTTPGGPLIAPWPGVVHVAPPNPGGFGTHYPIYTPSAGSEKGHSFYFGHTYTRHTGRVRPGTVVSVTGHGKEKWMGNAVGIPGHVEIGRWPPGGMTAGAALRSLVLGGSSALGAAGRGTTLAELWIQAGGARNLATTMAAIAMAESGGRTDAVGGPNSDGTYDYGLWQINSSHSQFNKGQLLSDPAYNARAAVSIERSQGLHAWTTYTTGAYRAFLGAGATASPSYGGTRPDGSGNGSGSGSGAEDKTAEQDAIFAAYTGELDAGMGTGAPSGTKNVGLFGLPLGPDLPFLPGLPFDPLSIFKDTGNAISDVSSFLHFIAWIFHPRNILRVVEFLTGITIMIIGIHTAIEVHRDAAEIGGGRRRRGGGRRRGGRRGYGRQTTVQRVTRQMVSASPAGRAARVAQGVSAGRRQERFKAQSDEFNRARRKAAAKEREKQKTKRGERNTRAKYGDKPPF